MNFILTNKDVMSDSVFYSFFNNKPNNLDDSLSELQEQTNNEEPLVIERRMIEVIDDNKLEENQHDTMLKMQISSIINEEISKIFILYEVNYYTAFKKRFFVITKNNKYLYKLKYDKFYNKFYIREQVKLRNIYQVKKTKITNTTYLKNKEILIIKFNKNGESNEFILTSLSDEKQHNINTLFGELKEKLEEKLKENNRCKFLISDSYIFDTGIGISEKIHHNSITKNVKKIVTDNIFKSKSYLRSLW
jgi:predicted transposase YdaD